jgi:L-lysine 2,3-aminomutase
MAQSRSPAKIPLEFASLIDKDNPNDPLLKQVIPSIKPQIETLDFSIEPLKDEENSPVAGLIHKYPNRVLLITSRVCAIHCQYCLSMRLANSNGILIGKPWS